MVRMAMVDPGAFVRTRDVAESETIPVAFAGKLFGQMVDAGLLRSATGPTGGYQLARATTAITLYDIRAAIDGIADLDACAIGLAVCSQESPCPLHDKWKPLRQGLERYLRATTLSQMVEAVERKEAQAPARPVRARR
jgi:Rrf2 family transcriptional regulator, iron-sulfur cluster assembly transcription factor